MTDTTDFEYTEMTDEEQAAAIKAHGIAHEKMIAKKHKARIARDNRKKQRGLETFIRNIKNNSK